MQPELSAAEMQRAIARGELTCEQHDVLRDLAEPRVHSTLCPSGVR